MRSHLRLALVLPAFALVACGSAPAPRPAAPQKAPVAAAPSTTPAPVAPAPPAPTAETCDGIRECASVGIELNKRGDASARVALAKACTGAVRSIDACAALTAIYLADEEVDPATLADAAQHGCISFGAEDGDKEARAVACATWGFLLRDGRGTAQDPEKALHAFDDGCKLGQPRACEARREMEEEARRAEDVASGVPGANLRIASVQTNGVTVERIACRAEGGALGGLFGSLAVGKPFADKKRQLDACAKGAPHTTRVRWTEKNGRMTAVTVISGDDRSNKCIERTLTGAVATVPGTCAASVDVGSAQRAGAKAAKAAKTGR